jgi:tetratricopeptide (TPR) repeat protein
MHVGTWIFCGLIVIAFIISRIPRFQKGMKEKNSFWNKLDWANRKELQKTHRGAVRMNEGNASSPEKFAWATELIHGEKTEEAVKLYKSMVDQPENRELALIGLGTCAILDEQAEEAMSFYAQAIVMNEQNYMSFLGMGTANFKMGDIPSSILYYKKALTLNPRSPDIYWGLALAYDKLPDAAHAVANAKQFLMMVPKSNYASLMEAIIQRNSI